MTVLATPVTEIAPTNMEGARRWRALGRLSIAVYILFIALFLAAPVLIVILVSFDTADYVQFPPSGLTLNWYARIAASETWRTAIVNSAIVGTGSTLLVLVTGVPAAYLIARRDFRARNALLALLLSPLTVPWVVFGLAVLNFWSAANLPRNLLAIIVAHSVIGLPYVVRTCLAVLVNISPSYELAARTLGADQKRAFMLVILPMLQMAIISGAIFCMLISFINVPVPLFLTTPSTLTMQVAIFSQMLSNTDPTVAAVSTIQLAMILLAFYIGQRVARLGDFL